MNQTLETNLDFKSTFIELLLNAIKNKDHWAKELSSVLNVSIDAIYKKHRQESFYTVEEIVLLCRTYHLSLDQIIHNQKQEVKFKIQNKITPVKDIHSYLHGLKMTFSKLNQLSDYQILYATRELPIFYYFLNDSLTQFKLFVYSKAIWKIPSFAHQSFNPSLFDPDILNETRFLWSLYSEAPTEEFWSNNILDNTLQQLKFYYDAGEISQQNTLQILEGIADVCANCKTMTVSNSKTKTKPNNFKLYENKILHTTNHVLVLSNQYNALYLTFDNPNYLMTQDTEFIQYSISWYNTIRENSYILGTGGGHNTALFFKELTEKIDRLKNYVIGI